MTTKRRESITPTSPTDEAPDALEGQRRDEEAHYTAFIRLPFPRGDFVDPPLVDWPPSKDRQLWQILSQSPRSSELDWKQLAAQFDVTVAFILQQAAWLYEQQLSQVRAQMRKVGRPLSIGNTSNGGSPNPQGAGASGLGENTSRPTSSASTSKAKDLLGSQLEATAKSRPSTMSRIPSTSTVTQSRHVGHTSPRIGRGSFSKSHEPGQRDSTITGQRPGTQLPRSTMPPRMDRAELADENAADNLADSSSESEEEDNNDGEERAPARSQMFSRQAQRRMTARGNAHETESENEEDEGPTFLPPSELKTSERQDLGATVRTTAESSRASEDNGGPTESAGPHDERGKGRALTTVSSMSEASSASSAGPERAGAGAGRRGLGALSPQQRAELTGGKSSRRSKKEGSEGTPSMGSSFSDLDDASVTQSAMEEYYLSKMQHGAASRMSTFSQALRSTSKYLPQQHPRTDK
ncbi:hypothetical protein FH972_024113 [Carpinus fangiana]|uniref:Autophagy-related protein 29 n=1 Tax=Carpinus fangiana TaxID=176857 RepID=A0A5N6KX43_9ROSI|nr:hypothetical protein FH972_024113 [Carpinus fangiana]